MIIIVIDVLYVITISLKVNKNTGAYACYSNDCFKDKNNKYLLYKHLGSLNRFSSSDRFSYTSTVKEYIVPKLITESIQLATVIKQPKYTKSNNVTTYYYDNFHRVIRTDLEHKKLFLPQYYDKNTYEWIDGKDGCWMPFKPIKYSSDVLISNEGEKAVIACSEAGIASFTFRSYTEEEISYALDFIDCSGVIVIADNDLVGIKKAELVQKCCWKKNIAANVIDIKELWTDISEECTKGADIYDLLMYEPDLNIEKLINEYLKIIC